MAGMARRTDRREKMKIEAYEIDGALEIHKGTFDNGAEAMRAINADIAADAEIKFVAVEADANGRAKVVDTWIAS